MHHRAFRALGRGGTYLKVLKAMGYLKTSFEHFTIAVSNKFFRMPKLVVGYQANPNYLVLGYF